VSLRWVEAVQFRTVQDFRSMRVPHPVASGNIGAPVSLGASALPVSYIQFSAVQIFAALTSASDWQ
jgi:hypothetical protein